MGDLEVGKGYLLDWEPPGNDPDSYDFSGYTLGTHYIEIDKLILVDQHVSTVKTSTDHPVNTDGNNQTTALGFYADITTVRGYLTRKTMASNCTMKGLWDTFIAEQRTDTTLYLVLPLYTNCYFPHYDTDNSTIREYCRGTTIGDDFFCRYTTIGNNSRVFEVGLTFKSSW